MAVLDISFRGFGGVIIFLVCFASLIAAFRYVGNILIRRGIVPPVDHVVDGEEQSFLKKENKKFHDMMELGIGGPRPGHSWHHRNDER